MGTKAVPVEPAPRAIDPSLRIGAVALAVVDVPRSVDFYAHALGLPLIARDERSARLGPDREHPALGLSGLDDPVTAAPHIRQIILERGQRFGARAVGEEAFEVARIEAGVPREGPEISEKYILLETGCETAVSYTKGCYLGQEIIARIHWRGQPAKRLMGLLIEADAVPPPGAELYSADGKRVGEVTSSTRSIALGRLIALGYVHRHYLTPDTELILKSGESELGRAKVTTLPFNR